MPMTTHQRLGDELPTALASYYDALDRNRVADAAAAFAADVTFAAPPLDGIETGPRSVSHGHDDLRAGFEDRGPNPYVHDVVLCAVEGRDAIVEGVTRDRESGAPQSSFAASLQLDDDGAIARYLAFRSPDVIAPLPADANSSPAAPGSAIDKIHEYFDALDEHRLEDAAECFSVDTLYSHPPYQDPTVGGHGRAAFAGRAELIAAFHRRGPQPIDHRIVFHAQRGPHLVLEGVVDDANGALRGSFVSEATLDNAGLIVRYASWYTQPGVPRR
jgi:SnoaL-like domain